MIRIDEIYSNTFWPWMQENFSKTRLFYCDPPGHTGIDNLFNHGRDDIEENNYVFFHDQEPVHIDIFGPLFDEVIRRNADMINKVDTTLPGLTLYPYTWDKKITLPKFGNIITSEHNSEFVEKLCAHYGWKPYYYFYHGWAALDWYRGYDKTFLIPAPEQRTIKKSFISPNRIIGGKRDHRVLLMYHLLKKNVNNAWISFPKICPVENKDVIEISSKFRKVYPDIMEVFGSAELPFCFPDETDHPMHSCWLSLFKENTQSLAHVITETVFSGRRSHLTEKTFKPICLQMPFVMLSTAGSLEYLKSYGFRTFDNVWNEDYDQEVDDIKRIAKVADLLKWLDDCTEKELNQLYRHCYPMIKHNYNHFYNGEFESILWKELNDMLDKIKNDWKGY